MKIKQKLTVILVAIVAFMGAGMAVAPVASAATCGKATTSIISCKEGGGAKELQNNPIWAVLIQALNIMTAGVGILAVGGVVYASILYASSSDNAEQTKRAKDIIKNIAIGILAYIGMYVLINFLVPGGVFK